MHEIEILKKRIEAMGYVVDIVPRTVVLEPFKSMLDDEIYYKEVAYSSTPNNSKFLETIVQYLKVSNK